MNKQPTLTTPSPYVAIFDQGWDDLVVGPLDNPEVFVISQFVDNTDYTLDIHISPEQAQGLFFALELYLELHGMLDD